MERALHPHETAPEGSRLSEEFTKTHVARLRPCESASASFAERRPHLKPSVVVGVAKHGGVAHAGKRRQRGSQVWVGRCIERLGLPFDQHLVAAGCRPGYRLQPRIDLRLRRRTAPREPGSLHPAEQREQEHAGRHHDPEQPPALAGREEVAWAGRIGSRIPAPPQSMLVATSARAVHGAECSCVSPAAAAAFCRRISRQT